MVFFYFNYIFITLAQNKTVTMIHKTIIGIAKKKFQAINQSVEAKTNVPIKLKIETFEAELQPSPKHWQTVSK